MDREFYTISIYVDDDENLIGIPCGESKEYGIADIDKVILLNAPYSAPQLEKYIEEVIDACYTKKHNDKNPKSTIERYTGKSSFVEATSPYLMISLVKTAMGYSIMPTFHDYERGPLVIDEDERIVPLDYDEGKLYKEIYDIISTYKRGKNQLDREFSELEAKYKRDHNSKKKKNKK